MISDQQISNALTSSRGLVSLAATSLGCSPQTIYNRLKHRPELAELMKAQRERIVDVAEQRLFEAVEAGKPWAVSLLLKTLGKARGYTEKTEHVVAPANPYEGMSDEDKAQRLQEIIDAARRRKQEEELAQVAGHLVNGDGAAAVGEV